MGERSEGQTWKAGKHGHVEVKGCAWKDRQGRRKAKGQVMLMLRLVTEDERSK